VKQIDNIKDNNILKIEQLCLDYKIRIGVKTTDFQVLDEGLSTRKNPRTPSDFFQKIPKNPKKSQKIKKIKNPKNP
jgi:hypothetical protein